jgi:hypothetical protein
MDALISVVIGCAIGAGLLALSKPLPRGWASFCEEEWSVTLDRRTESLLRSALVLTGVAFILLGMISALRA